jgi:starvation-inducible DNA-binding protein
MKPDIGIADKNLQKSIKILTVLLADEMVLYIKSRKFHWNVSGSSFMELHQLFQSQYKELEESIDLIAERINKLGGKTIGTMKEFADQTRLTEVPNKYPNKAEMLKELLTDHEQVITDMRKDIEEASEKVKDIGTIDFLTGLMEQHETIAWVLRRYLN